MFPCGFCEIFKYTFFTEHLRATASVELMFFFFQKKSGSFFFERREKTIKSKGKLEYSWTSLKQTLTGQKFLSALEWCPPWRGLNRKVPKFKIRLFYTGPTLTRSPPPPYLTMGMWNGEKEVILFVKKKLFAMLVSQNNVFRGIKNSFQSKNKDKK